MTIRRLESGAWHLRFGSERFAQWFGAYPKDGDFFGDWSQAEKDHAVKLALRHTADREATE